MARSPHASDLVPLTKLATNFKGHAKGILNRWRGRFTNGLIEGMNSLIQSAIAKARGSQNPKNLITRAYLIVGKLSFLTSPPWPSYPPETAKSQKVNMRPCPGPR